MVYRNKLKGESKKVEEKKEEMDPMKRMKEQIKQTKESYLKLIEQGKVTDETKREAILSTIEMLDRQIFQLENGIDIEVMGSASPIIPQDRDAAPSPNFKNDIVIASLDSSPDFSPKKSIINIHNLDQVINEEKIERQNSPARMMSLNRETLMEMQAMITPIKPQNKYKIRVIARNTLNP